jgi:hypothetical protein
MHLAAQEMPLQMHGPPSRTHAEAVGAELTVASRGTRWLGTVNSYGSGAVLDYATQSNELSPRRGHISLRPLERALSHSVPSGGLPFSYCRH